MTRDELLELRQWQNLERLEALEQAVLRHLPALKDMAAQIIDPRDNAFSRMVNDLERHL